MGPSVSLLDLLWLPSHSRQRMRGGVFPLHSHSSLRSHIMDNGLFTSLSSPPEGDLFRAGVVSYLGIPRTGSLH